MHEQRPDPDLDNVPAHADSYHVSTDPYGDNVPAHADSYHVSTEPYGDNVPANTYCHHFSTDADCGDRNSNVTRANSGGFSYCSASDTGPN
jgi:hypothetical protein